MATEDALDRAGIKLPDEYRFASAGHWIDVINSSYDHDQIRLHFTTPADRTVEVDISLKDARELRKELKAAITPGLYSGRLLIGLRRIYGSSSFLCIFCRSYNRLLTTYGGI